VQRERGADAFVSRVQRGADAYLAVRSVETALTWAVCSMRFSGVVLRAVWCLRGR